jgi:serine/threonine-protein kinase HipA
MNPIEPFQTKYCPGTLAEGFHTYSQSCLKRMFDGKTISHILPYNSPNPHNEEAELLLQNLKRISISGIQLKYSLILEKNILRLIKEGEQGPYILKPIPDLGKRRSMIPANEHVTMQIARQVFDIDTAENVLIFFQNGEAAYLTKRFDVRKDSSKWSIEDFASLAIMSPQSDGADYKYQGNYLQLFELLKNLLPSYKVEAPKLLKRLLFNYLFSNGDAHWKNFSLMETQLGDFKLSPAYDLLNTQLHVDDSTFALEGGLLPSNLKHGKIQNQFATLAHESGINLNVWESMLHDMLSNSQKVESFVAASFLDEKSKRAYFQAYQGRLNKLKRR